MSDYQIFILPKYEDNDTPGLGEWFDCEGLNSDDVEEVFYERDGRDFPIEELQITQESKGFDGIRIKSDDSIETIAEIARLLEEHGKAFQVWYTDNGGDYYSSDELEDEFMEQFQGEFDSLRDWAEQYWEDTGMLSEIPEFLRNYIDYDALARDARLGGDISVIERGGSVYVFSNH